MRKTQNADLHHACLVVMLASQLPSNSHARTPLDANVVRQVVAPSSLTRSAILAQPVLSRVQMQARDTRNDLGPDTQARTPTEPLNETSVLSSFRLGFSNGDHHVKKISVLRQNEKALGTLSDNNGDDNYTFTASWWNIPGTVSGEVSGSAGHVWNLSTVTIPEGPPDTTLALVGFSLALPEDREVKRLKVQLDGPSRSFMLSLQPSDNSSVGSGSYALQYAWVPNSALKGNLTATGSGMGIGARAASQVSGTLPVDNRYILRGFELGYNDSNQSAQNLLRVGVHLTPAANPNLDRDVVSWEDNDRNERISWRVDYSPLK